MDISVRDATDSDLRFVRRLAQDAILHTIPYSRATPNSAVQSRARENLRDLKPDDDTLILIAYQLANDRPVGYLILELNDIDVCTGDRQSYIFDLAVDQRYWGTPAVRHLVHEASRRTAKAGLTHMSGEITAHNQRTYLQALRLGFELERFKIVMGCSEEGPAPLPSRDDSERAYQASRSERGRNRRVATNWREVRQDRDKK